MQKLDFPLYHGTSTVFLKSIQEYGLGGINIIEKYNVIGLLKKLEDFADDRLSGEDEWVYGQKYPTSLITNQKEKFRHGRVYLTPSRSQAGLYSTSNNYGEGISEIFRVKTLLQKKGIKPPTEFWNDFQELFDFTKNESRPVVLEIENLPTHYLKKGERGEDVQTLIESIKSDILHKNGRWLSQMNFEASTIPFNYISVL